MAEDEEPKPIIKVGDVVKKRFEVTKQLGQGGFGAVFEVVDKTNGERYALKLELEKPKKDEPGLDLEVGVLKRLQFSSYVVHFIESGKVSKLTFLIMQLIGSNLGDLRRACPDRRFTLKTAIRLSLRWKELKLCTALVFCTETLNPLISQLNDQLKISELSSSLISEWFVDID